MSYAPQSLLDARAYLMGRTGLTAAALGIVGDPAHGNEGYHVGWDRLQSGYGWDDYSVAESPRDYPSDAAMALDIGNFPRLRELSEWLVAQCRAGAADTTDIREIIYSLDGRVVRRWDRLGIRSSGDSSHLTHTHISYFRNSEASDKTALFRRFFEGGGIMSDWDEKMTIEGAERTMRSWLGQIWGMTRDCKNRLDQVIASLAELRDRPTAGMTDAQVQAVATQVAAQVRPQMPTAATIAAEIIRQLRE